MSSTTYTCTVEVLSSTANPPTPLGKLNEVEVGYAYIAMHTLPSWSNYFGMNASMPFSTQPTAPYWQMMSALSMNSHGSSWE